MSRYNYSGIVVGLPESGKTTLVKDIIAKHLRDQPRGIVLAHDPVRQFVKAPPKGLGFAWYPDVNAYKRAAAAAARDKTPIARGVSIGGSSDEVVKLACDIGERAGNDQWQVNIPILIPQDEGSMRDGSGSTYIGKQDNQTLSTRRHKGVGMLLLVQERGQLMAHFWKMATDVYIFRQSEERAYEFDKLLYLPKGSLVKAGVCQLPQFRYVHVRIAAGDAQIVRDAL